MKPVSIMHIADMHLGACVSAFDHEKNLLRTREIEHTCINALKSAGGYDIVLMPGDIFDSPDVSARMADMFLDAVACAPNTHFFYSCGNHDPYISPVIDHCVKNCPPNLHIFAPEFLECVTLSELGVRVYGISFATPHQNSSLADATLQCDSAYINLLCMHGEINSNSSSVYNPVSVSRLSGCGFEYAAFGHIHSFSGICRAGSLSYAYCGTPEPRGFDECGDMGCICGYVGKNDIDLKFKPLAKRLYIDCNLDISDIRDYPSLISAVSAVAECRDNIYRITLCGENQISAMINTDLLESHVDAFYIKITDATRHSYNIADFADDITLKGVCAREALSLIADANAEDAELYSKAFALLFDLFDKRGDEYDN